MKSSKVVAYALIVIVLVAAAGAVLYYTKRGGEHQQETTQNTTTSHPTILNPNPATGTRTLTLQLGPGSNVTVYVEGITYVGPPNGSANATSYNTTVNLTINSYKWPFTNATIEPSGNAQNQTLPLFFLEAPKELVGKGQFAAPISLPGINEGFCINLTLVTSNDTVYVYKSSIELFNYKVNITYKYDKNGVAKEIIYNIKSIKPVNNNILNMTSIIKVVSYSTPGPVEVEVPANWTCNPPLSSHLWFTWEGIYKVSDCKITRASVNELRDAIGNSAIVFFLNKGCPHCIRTWPNILEALYKTCGNASNIDIYIVVFGGFMDSAVSAYLQNTMVQNGLNGYPAIAYFRGGFARDKLLGERSVDEIVAFIEKYASGQG